jgi:hypothetical protein
MAATVRLLGSTWNTNNGTKSVTATPAVGELIVIITAHSGNAGAADKQPTDNNNSGTYFLVTWQLKNSSSDSMQIHIRNAQIGSAVSTVFTHAPGTTSGGGMVVLAVAGMDAAKVGNLAVRYVNSVGQWGGQSNQGAGGTPTPTLPAAASTTNPIIAAVFNASNPAGLTERSGYTEHVDLGYTFPTSGIAVMSINSGETASAIPYGGFFASAFCSAVVELDAQASIHLAGTVDGTAALEAGLTVSRPLAGALDAVVGVTGELAVRRILVGQVAAQAACEALLQVARRLTGQIEGASELAAAVHVTRPLVGVLLATTTIEAQLAVARHLAGAVDAEALLAALLSVGAGVLGEPVHIFLAHARPTVFAAQARAYRFEAAPRRFIYAAAPRQYVFDADTRTYVFAAKGGTA